MKSLTFYNKNIICIVWQFLIKVGCWNTSLVFRNVRKVILHHQENLDHLQ